MKEHFMYQVVHATITLWISSKPHESHTEGR